MKAVFTFGRMNPPTVGHQKLVDKVKAVARLEKGEPLIFLSHSQDKKKNPLQYTDKIKFAKKSFGKVVQMSKSNTIIKVMQELEKKYSDVIMVVGSDRVDSMKELINKYNGKDYTFNSIEVVSAGARDPDADGVEGMSASKMRELATSGDEAEFISGLPKLLQRDGSSVYAAVRKGMGISEIVAVEKAPPGREKQVKALKKKFDDPGAPYAIAWAQHNKHGKPSKMRKEEAEDLDEGSTPETFFLKLNEEAILEALKPKQTSFGTDADASNGQFFSVNFPSHGRTLVTVFKESEKPYLVFLDSHSEVGFMAYVSDKEYLGLKEMEFGVWSDTSDPTGRRKRAFGGVWRVFNKVFFVILKLIEQKNPSFIKFNGATPDLQKVYDRMSENEPFLKSLSDVGFKYDGKRGDHHHFVKKIQEAEDLDEGRLMKIAALALSLGIAMTGDGAFVSRQNTDKFDKVYNSLTVNQKNRLKDIIRQESKKISDKTL